MDVLLRQLRRAPDGTAEYQDTEISADQLSVGSGADCTIQLLGEGVASHHAVIRGSARALTIACARGCKLEIQGKAVDSASLPIGGEVKIGGNRLRSVEPPGGFDVAIEIEADTEVEASAYERAFRTDLAATWLSKRGGAWLLAALVLALGLLIPYGSIPPQRAGKLPPPYLPSDRIWSAGPLIPAHELAAGKRCAGCHERIFIHVRDAACHECHKTLLDHVEASRLKSTRLGPPQRCAQCHREHNAPVTGLVVRDDQLCIDCHADSSRRFGALKVKSVTGFSSSAHPAFTVTLFKPAANANGGLIDWVARPEPIGAAHEQSNLKFSHAQHLDVSRVTRLSDGGALGCSDCHVPDADGEHFVPITMQRSCGACHELTFDPNAPDRLLPHGRPRDAILLIQDYFARQAVDPTPTQPTRQRRRLPDEVTPEEVCSGNSLSCAARRAQFEIETQFKTKGCASCHNVTDTRATDVLDRYQVAPVRLTRDYFPDVHFSHRLHAVQKGKSGDEACLSCHAVQKSKSSADVFIPDLPKCLECHSEKLTLDRVALQCSSCHSYHPKTIIDRPREGEVQ